MSNKVKLILIILEIAILLMLFLLGAACQQRWIVITGNGPRIDWYADGNTGAEESEPDSDPIVDHSPVPELSETTEPVTTPPATRPEDPTEESTEETTEPEDTTAPTFSGTREDELPLVPIG